jgi:hypothetical protein
MTIKQGKDVRALFYYNDGTLILTTKRSHGSGKLDGNVPHMIRQQMKLNEEQFKELIACPLKRDGYIAILRNKGLIIDKKKTRPPGTR